MSGGEFPRRPVTVPPVRTKYRTIRTAIPVPESIPVLEKLDRLESRSMHGQLPVVWARAEGAGVEDAWGNRWIDFTSTIFVTNAGHAHPHIVQSLRAALDQKLLHTYTFAHAARVRFLEKLIQLTPSYLEKAYLVSAGTEATEAALKLMRLHGLRRSPARWGVVSFRGSMHGRTMGAELMKGNSTSGAWIGHTDPHLHHLEFPAPWAKPEGLNGEKRFELDLEGLWKSGVKLSDLCGFMIESYVGWGALFFPPDYIQALVRFARANDLLVTFDEIQGGLGRTGRLFVYEHYGVEPDLICLGKGLSSSLPLAAVLGRAEIMDLPDVGSMSSTHSANPLCCAAGLANLEVLEREDLVGQSARKGERLHSRLKDLQGRYPQRISHVMGKGLLAALLLRVPSTGKPDGAFATRVCEKAMRKGLLLVHTGRESIKMGPPLTIPEDALEEGLDVLVDVFAEADREAAP